MPGHMKNVLSTYSFNYKTIRQNADTVKIDYTTNTYF